jgi:hypothetical protein
VVSLERIHDDIGDLRHNILLLMQEGDTSAGFEANSEWADELYAAWEQLGEVIKHVRRARIAG